MIEYGKAICYSGYRKGQCPDGKMPSKEQIREDLEILLADGYRYLRMYDPNEHARMVLETIRENKMPLQCIIGVDNYAEVNNPTCPDEKQEKSEQELKMNAERNDREVEKLIAMVKEFPEEIFAVSIGNENTPSWGKRIVPVERLMMHAKRFKETIDKPVTFCEGVLEWKSLQKLAELMDFISIHSYPLHYGNTIDEALEVNKKQYAEISALYPDKQVIFTELGWATKARDELKKSSSSEENQTRYIKEVTEWFEEDKIIGFIFEAFDESWKGEAEDSCECNWGLYYESRQPKPVIASLKSK